MMVTGRQSSRDRTPFQAFNTLETPSAQFEHGEKKNIWKSSGGTIAAVVSPTSL